MAIWKNNDGLVLRFGTSEGAKAVAYEYSTMTGEGLIEITLYYTNLPAFGAVSTSFDGGYATGGLILSDDVRIPEGIIIRSVEFQTETAWASSGSAITMDVGLIKESDRSTEKDFNGLVDAITQTEINAAGAGALGSNTTNVAGWVGALVGTKLDSTTTAGPWLLTVKVSTATATAGKSLIRLRYYVPPKTTDTLGSSTV